MVWVSSTKRRIFAVWFFILFHPKRTSGALFYAFNSF